MKLAGKMFGSVAPTKKVRIQVQNIVDGRPESTISYIVVGHSVKSVLRTLDEALSAAYPPPEDDPEEEVGEDEEFVEPTPPMPRRRKLKVRK